MSRSCGPALLEGIGDLTDLAQGRQVSTRHTVKFSEDTDARTQGRRDSGGSPHRPPSQEYPVSTSRPRRSRLALVLAATFGLVVALAQGVVGPASASSLPAPTSMVVKAYSDPAVIGASLAGAPADAIPTVLAGKGDAFLVSVTLRAGTLDAAFPNDQDVTLTASGPGALPSATRTIPGGATTTVFTVSYSAEATGVKVQASAGKGNKAVSGTSNAFDVNRVLSFVPGASEKLRDGTAGADGAGCAVVDRDHPMCGIVVLPKGASSDVALSLGLCPAGESCVKGALVTQMIANLTDATGTRIYDRSNPARMEIICDKSLCGKAGVPSFTALWSRSAVGALVAVPPCASKGVIDSTLEYCTDYRASQRDGAGDVHLVVWFLDDVRGSI
ncbi:hypothetical protein [Knoellia sp. Soil729]|uniref:hypothetical protein n=1 Tax=Knoellia sp. Soil729 TaxID=1736394 RepID=UPI00138F18ED|nr:hypothetical protein [Knoellia sp. Soil729]